MRLVLVLILAALVALGAGWLAAHPGTVRIVALGWELETGLAVAALALGLVLALTALGAGLVFGLAGLPGRFRRWRESRTRSRAARALGRAMVALAAGESAAARRFSARAEAFPSLAPVARMLGVQAAQLEGDEAAAESGFRAMLDDPETEFLGLRGLLIQAGRRGDMARALAYAERAAALQPRAAWVQETLFELAVKAGLWKEAETALKRARRRKALAPPRAARHRAVLLYQQSVDAEARGFAVEALTLARRAVRAAPDLVPVALRLARLERLAGSSSRARKVLERAFVRMPHPDLARALLETAESEGGTDPTPAEEEALALARLRLAEVLVKRAPDHPEGHMAVAETASAARLWGEARRHLRQAEALHASLKLPLPARFWRLRASVLEAESGDPRAGDEARAQAGQAAADPRWLCESCGGESPGWSPFCPHCQAFDSLAWRRPDDLVRLVPAAAATLAGPVVRLAGGRAGGDGAAGPLPGPTASGPRE